MHNETMLQQVIDTMQTRFDDVLDQLKYQSGESMLIDSLLDTIHILSGDLSQMIQNKANPDYIK